MTMYFCSCCQALYPETGLPHRCPVCGGLYESDACPVLSPLTFSSAMPSFWDFGSTFDLFPGALPVTLGEGRTPLAWTDWQGHAVGLKLEYLNPTGSYKDRGTAVTVSQLQARGVDFAVEDSSGNAGASFAAYAARAGMRARVYVPASASGPKLRQIAACGAEVRRIPGPRSEAARAVLEDVQAGAVYASHAFLPFSLPGIATLAYELFYQLGSRVPGTIVSPVGHGGLLAGTMRGFAALQANGLTSRQPYWVGVQAAACAPFVHAWRNNLAEAIEAGDRPTLAEGVRVRTPSRAAELLALARQGKGVFIPVEENSLVQAHIDLARRGFFVEPTSALVWAILPEIFGKVPDPVVLLLTGSGLKSLPQF